MFDIGLTHYMLLAVTVFVIGMSGLFIKKQNIIGVLVSIELMLLGVNINMVSIGMYMKHLESQIFTIFILTVAAAEAAVGLAILILYFKKTSNIEIGLATRLKG